VDSSLYKETKEFLKNYLILHHALRRGRVSKSAEDILQKAKIWEIRNNYKLQISLLRAFALSNDWNLFFKIAEESAPFWFWSKSQKKKLITFIILDQIRIKHGKIFNRNYLWLYIKYPAETLEYIFSNFLFFNSLLIITFGKFVKIIVRHFPANRLYSLWKTFINIGNGPKHITKRKKYIPKFLVLPITYKCNCRCKMCNIWKTKGRQKDRKTIEILKNLQNPDFKEIEGINLTGGEPFLNSEINNIVIRLSKIGSINKIGISSNGILTEKIIQNVIEWFEKLSYRFKLAISLSIDGIGQKHDKIRNYEGAFRKTWQTFEILRLFSYIHPNFNVGLTTTISTQKPSEIQELLSILSLRKIKTSLTPSISSNIFIEGTESFINTSNVQDWQEIFRKNFYETQDPFYLDLIQIVKGKTRKYECVFWSSGYFLDSNSCVYKCSVAKETFLTKLPSKIIQDKKIDSVLKKIKNICNKCLNNCAMGFVDRNLESYINQNEDIQIIFLGPKDDNDVGMFTKNLKNKTIHLFENKKKILSLESNLVLWRKDKKWEILI